MKHLAAALALFFVLPCRAEPRRFGAEFTVRKEGDVVAVIDALEELRREITRNCGAWKCEVEAIKDRDKILRYRVKYEDGFYFDLSFDDKAIEATPPPGTAAEWKDRKERLDAHFFGTAAKLGLTPAADRGGGHVHLDAGLFDGDPMLFRNFVVDYFNHVELAYGVFRHEVRKATAHWAHLSAETQEAFRSVIGRFDAASTAGKPWTAKELAEALYAEVQKPAFQRGEVKEARNFALNLERFALFPEGERTVEIRAVRPQRGLDDFLVVLKLLEARLDHLKAENKPIPVAAELPKTETSWPVAAVARFEGWLGEMGLNLADYRGLLPPDWLNCEGVYRPLKPPGK